MSNATKVQHTPGPWELATSCSWRRFVGPDGLTVCEPVTQVSDGHPDLFFRNGGSDGPDARLIAAAPDLLAAAVEMDALMEHLWKAVPWGQTFGLDIAALNEVPVALKRAIAKARGEG